MIFSYIVIFVCVWWIIFYMSLPFGAKITRAPDIGHSNGAPTKPYLRVKMIVTTLIASLLTYIFIYIIDGGYLAKFSSEYMKWLSSFMGNNLK